MLLDIIVIAIIALFAFSGFKRGLVYSIIGVFGSLIAAALSSLAATFLSLSIYESFFLTRIQETVAESLSALPEISSASQKAQCLFDSMPSVLVNTLNLTGITQDSLTNEIKTSMIREVPVLVESLVRPMIVRLITIILTAILFVVFTFLIKLAANVLTKTIDIAKLSTANKLAGAIFGLGEAVVLIMVFSLILYFIMMFLSPEHCMSVQNMIDSSYLYKGIYQFSLPDAIISAFTIK